MERDGTERDAANPPRENVVARMPKENGVKQGRKSIQNNEQRGRKTHGKSERTFQSCAESAVSSPSAESGTPFRQFHRARTVDVPVAPRFFRLSLSHDDETTRSHFSADRLTAIHLRDTFRILISLYLPTQRFTEGVSWILV